MIVPATGGLAQTPEADGREFTQPPARKNLSDVRHPDVTKLETEVREQIIGERKVLLDTAADQNSTGEKLGQAYGRMGEIYQLYSFFEAALACYLNARKLEPGEFRWAYLAGKSAQQENKPDEALKIYEEARRIKPDYPTLLVNSGDLYLELNRTDEAAAAYRKALETDEKSAAAVYGLGQIELARRNFLIAAVYFERVLELVPEANRVYYSLGLAYRGQKELEKARVALEKQGPVGVRAADPLFDSLQKHERGARLHILRGKLALEAGRFADSADEYQKALSEEPENIPALVNLGAVLIQMGKEPEAIELFQRAVRIEPKNTNARFNLGMLLALQGKHLEALSHFQTIARENPKDFEARFQIGEQFLRLGRDDEALDEFSQIESEKPELEKALIAKVNILLKKGRYAEVKEALEKSYARFPDHGRTVVLLARFLAASPQYDLRDGARALELAQLVYQTSGSIEHGVLVAMALAEMVKCGEAARWQKAMIERALKAGDRSLAQSLEPDLRRYQNDIPCRP